MSGLHISVDLKYNNPENSNNSQTSLNAVAQNGRISFLHFHPVGMDHYLVSCS